MKISTAIVGCGRMGAFSADLVRSIAPKCWFPLSHADAVLAHNGLSLDALCDSDEAALSKAAAFFNVQRTYLIPALLLEDAPPTLLCLATRTPGRAQCLIDAAQAGVLALHVEKPLCNGVRELAELRALFESTGIFATYGTIRRFMTPYRVATELASSGQYGALQEIRVCMGPSTLYWTHPHSIDLILFSAGKRRVTSVQARLAEVEVQNQSGLCVETDPKVVSASIYFEDGVVGHITQGIGCDLVLSCADAEIVVRSDGWTIDIYRARAGSFYPIMERFTDSLPTDQPSGTLAALTQLVDCLNGDALALEGNRIVKNDMLQGQQISFAMLQSHVEGSRMVSPDAADPSIFIHARTRGRPA